MDEIKKKVDQSWKQGVEKEKQEPKAQGAFVPPEPDFKFFITTLTLQASIALGHLANPATGKTEADPTQAKFLIDTLGMLQEKTKGNLNPEETGLLENLLYELRVAYLAKKRGPGEMIDQELLDILACPACKADVELAKHKIVCKKCGRKYPLRQGIPVMLIDQAEKSK